MGISAKPKLYQVLIKWFVLAGVICAGLSFAVFLLLSYQSVSISAALSLANVRDQQQILIERWLAEREADMQHLSLLAAVKENDASSLQRVFAGYLEANGGSFSRIVLAAPDGAVTLELPESGAVLNIKDTDYYEVTRRGEFFRGRVKPGAQDAQEAKDVGFKLITAIPVRRADESIAGIVCAEISSNELEKMLSSYQFLKTGKLLVFDGTGGVIAQSLLPVSQEERRLAANNSVARINVSHNVLDGIAAAATGLIEYKDSNGTKIMSAYVWSAQHKWGLAAEVEKKEILGNWSGNAWVLIPVLVLIIIACIFPLARRFAGIIVQPLTKIARKVGTFAENYKSDTLSWAVLDTPVYEEIDVLSQSFYLMGEKISQLMDILESQAQYDQLTGLANRHYYFKRSQQILELIQRNMRVCSLIFLDIDRFKSINDTHGHSVGDDVLLQLGILLEKNIRVSDAAGRLGGEEFSIILPDTDLDGALLLAERLRKRVEETPIVSGDKTLHITISLGVAAYEGTGVKINIVDVLEDLIKRADQAMYLAKQNGRNRVEIDRQGIGR